MTEDDGRAGVLLVRTWMHDGQLVARVHTWTSGQADQQAEVVVGSTALRERMLAWVAAFHEAPVAPR